MRSPIIDEMARVICELRKARHSLAVVESALKRYRVEEAEAEKAVGVLEIELAKLLHELDPKAVNIAATRKFS